MVLATLVVAPMSDDKKTLKVRCPECKKINIVHKNDFQQLAKITFSCAECGHKIAVDNPESSAKG